MGVRVGVVAVAVVLAVAGCSGGDAPSSALPSGGAPPQSSSPPSNPPSTAATTPPPTAPPLPATATQDTPAGAQSFARYYIAVLDYASHTGDTQSLRGLGDCGTCRAQADGIETVLQGGRTRRGRGVPVSRSHATLSRFLETAALVNVTYRPGRRKVGCPERQDRATHPREVGDLRADARTGHGFVRTCQTMQTDRMRRLQTEPQRLGCLVVECRPWQSHCARCADGGCAAIR